VTAASTGRGSQTSRSTPVSGCQYFAGQPHWFGKLFHYAGAADGADQQGVGPHTDWNFLTLLLQDDVGGLQARSAGAGRWIDVSPVDGALIVNIGEMLEVAIHGYLVATPHRVLPCASERTRDSIAIFWAPRLGASLDAVPLPREYAEQAPGVSP
jgi:isopenicillin N synthase-like dioxygenase